MSQPSQPSQPWDISAAIRGARRAARVCVPARFLSMIGDDVAQEVAIEVWLLSGQGVRVGRRGLRWAAVRAVRAIIGDPRFNGLSREHRNRAELNERTRVVDPDERRPLAFIRMQQVFPTLSPMQRRAVEAFLLGIDPGEVAREFDSSSSAVIEARRRAFERIDNPGAFTRQAWRPRDDESRRAYARERQRTYRARQGGVR